MWWIHTMKYYSAFKRKKILTYALAWINLEDTMLHETISITEGQILPNSTYTLQWYLE